MDDKPTDKPAAVAASAREIPPQAPTAPAAKRSPAEIADAIDATARRMLGGRARPIELLTAELRAQL